jgi:hypothetical protein
MTGKLDRAALAALLARKDDGTIRAALAAYHPYDLARLLPALPPERQQAVLDLLAPQRAGQVFGDLDRLAFARPYRRGGDGRAAARGSGPRDDLRRLCHRRRRAFARCGAGRADPRRQSRPQAARAAD